MKALEVLVGIMVFTIFVTQNLFARDALYFVAQDGSDLNPGTIEQPFGSLERAKMAVRQIEKGKTDLITVYLREGFYSLEEPVVFTKEDSGDNVTTIKYRAYGSEPVVLSGGFELSLTWQVEGQGTYSARVPDHVKSMDQLFVNGQRQHPARFPNYDANAKFFGGTSGDAISPERVKTWSNPEGGYMHALHQNMWGSKHYRIVSADDDGTLTLTGGWQENRGGGWDPVYRGGYHKDHLYVENIFEELDVPGEWYFNAEKKRLYLKPMPGVNLAEAKIVGAGLKQILVLKGDLDHPIRNLHFEGIQFKHTQRIFMEPYERLLRGDWSIARLAAVHLQGTEDCSIKDCTFEDLGGNGVLISQYNQRTSVQGCRFTRLGESCVALVGDRHAVRNPAIEYGTTIAQHEINLTPGPKTLNYPAQCVIHNNLMHHFGFIGKQVAGVVISMSEAITVSHNTIYQCPRAAICINDGCWGGHVLEFNDAFNTVRESGDHGPFNSWGRDRWWKTSYNGGRNIEAFAGKRTKLDNRTTTHIRNNRFAHPGGHSWGIDLDDGSSNYWVYNNLCLGMGVKLREGYFRRVENNIIINGFGGFHIWFPASQDVIRNNIWVTDQPYRFIRANPDYAKEINHNVFWAQDKQITIDGVQGVKTLDQWQARGFDVNSVVADPLFINPDQGDYRVKDNSPALALGFKNFPMNQFGVKKPEFQAEVARESRAFIPAPTATASLSQRDPKSVAWLGATIKNLIGEAEKSAAGIGTETGVLFIDVPVESMAAQAGFQLGDVIQQANGHSINSLKDLQRLLKTQSNDAIQFMVFNAVERRVVLKNQSGFEGTQ